MAQYGQGLRPYRAQERGAYQFGFTPTYEITVVNMSLQDLEFRLTRYKNEIQKDVSAEEGWIVPAGSFGTLDVMALAMKGEFRTRRGVRIPVDPVIGKYYGAFVVDEERLREYERRDVDGAIVIRDPNAAYNPNIEKPKYTTHTDEASRLMRGLRLLPTPRERPGKSGRFVTMKPGTFPPFRAVAVLDETEPRATTGRIRQPGEELVTISMVRAAGEIPAGARFDARIGHDLAYRSEGGSVDGDGKIKLFTTRDSNVRIEIDVSGQGAADTSTFTIAPAADTEFRVRIR